MRGVRLGSEGEHVRQVRDGRGVPQVHVDPQEGGLRALNPPLQCLLLRAPARARGWLGQRARGHLGALRAPVGARWCGGGYSVAFPAEVAGVREVGGPKPGVQAAEPEVIPTLSEGAPELQQAGANLAHLPKLSSMPIIARYAATVPTPWRKCCSV